MIIYLALIVVWGTVYLFIKELSNKYKYNWKLLYALISGGLLLIVMGLRHYTVGVDIGQYINNYNNYYTLQDLSLDIFKNDEYGFYFFNIILKKIGIGNQGYIFIMSLIMILFFWNFYYKYSKNMFLSIFLHLTIGLFTMSMSGIRQTIAIGFVLVAFHYMIERKPIKFVILVFLAYTFHNSAIVFLPVYFLRNFRINQRNGTILVLISSSLLIFRKLLVPIMEKFIPSRYSGYSLLSNAYPINPLLVLIAIMIPLVCLIFWDRIDRLESEEKELYSILFILSCLNIVFNILSLNSNLIGRVSFYFVPFNMVLIPNVISIIKDKKLRIIGIYFCIVLPLFQFLKSTPGGTLRIDNFKFFWQ